MRDYLRRRGLASMLAAQLLSLLKGWEDLLTLVKCALAGWIHGNESDVYCVK